MVVGIENKKDTKPKIQQKLNTKERKTQNDTNKKTNNKGSTTQNTDLRDHSEESMNNSSRRCPDQKMA